tara:strand:+ start:223 stop:1500 length:1278 start_codon:yes stop_codon:yes gene_type:complete
MAWTGNFKDQIDNLAGELTVSDDVAIEQWVLDGCYDALSKARTLKGPDEVWKFAAKSGNQTANDIDIDEIREITGVVVGGNVARPGDWFNKVDYSDIASIYYATVANPIWYIDDSKLSIYPGPSAANVANYYFIPEYTIVNFSTSISSIDNFPVEYYHSAMLYGALQVLHRRMLDTSTPTLLDELSLVSVPPNSPNITLISYSEPDSATITGIVDATVTSITGASSNQPTYTSPSSVTVIDASVELAKLKTLINDEEDSELAAAKAQEISQKLAEFSGKLQKFSSDMQDSQGVFNKENSIYNALVQQSSQNAQAENQTALQNMQKDMQVATGNAQNALSIATQEVQETIQNNNTAIQVYQAELQAYQADVSAEVQEYSAKMQKFSADTAAISKDYEWLEAQYQKVFGLYQQSFGAGPPPRQEESR